MMKSVELRASAARRGKHAVEAHFESRLLYRDEVNLGLARDRGRFIGGLIKAVPALQNEEGLECRLLKLHQDLESTEEAEIPEEDPSYGDGPKQADELIALAKDCVMFHDGNQQSFARFKVNEHWENWSLGSSAFRDHLMLKYFKLTDKAASSSAMDTAINTLKAKARFEGGQHEVHLRCTLHEQALWLDLVDESWRAVEVTKDGWRVVDHAPVYFVRRKEMNSLPYPKEGGDLNGYFELFNLAQHDHRILALSWLVAALLCQKGFPPLFLSGAQGSGKTTATRGQRRLIDPHKADVRSAPRSEHDVFIAATTGRVIAFENLSTISQDLSDTFCRVATGAAHATRQLYTDGEEFVLEACNPIIINAITELVTRPDLAQRSIQISLPAIQSRRTEAEIWKAFEEQHALWLGALLDIVARVLATPEPETSRNWRMADFAAIGHRMEVAMGWDTGTFAAAYNASSDDLARGAMESSPLLEPMTRMLNVEGDVTLTVGKMMEKIRVYADPGERNFPKSAKAFENEMRRLQHDLHRVGIRYQEGHRSAAGRMCTLSKLPGQGEG